MDFAPDRNIRPGEFNHFTVINYIFHAFFIFISIPDLIYLLFTKNVHHFIVVTHFENSQKYHF